MGTRNPMKTLTDHIRTPTSRPLRVLAPTLALALAAGLAACGSSETGATNPPAASGATRSSEAGAEKAAAAATEQAKTGADKLSAEAQHLLNRLAAEAKGLSSSSEGAQPKARAALLALSGEARALAARARDELAPGTEGREGIVRIAEQASLSAKDLAALTETADANRHLSAALRELERAGSALKGLRGELDSTTSGQVERSLEGAAKQVEREAG